MTEYTPLIVGLSGKKQSGKDTIADGLKAAHDIKKMSFADELKKFCWIHFGLPLSVSYGTDEQKNSYMTKVYSEKLQRCYTARELLQYFGTDVCRTFFGDIWLNGLLFRIRTYLEKTQPEERCDFIVVSDVRFKSEVYGIQDEGGIVIRLTRSLDEDKHTSETELDEFTAFNAILDNAKMDKPTQLAMTQKIINLAVKGEMKAREETSDLVNRR